MKWGKPPPPPDEGWLVIGEPLPGTDAAVDAIDRVAEGGSGAVSTISTISAVDAAFDANAFVGWTKTVYDRAVGAWKTRDPEPLRAVMDAAVWTHYAQHLLTVSTMPFAQSFMAAARATPSLAGSSADEGHQSAVISFAVVTDAPVDALWNVGPDRRAWSERWLFQRPSSCRTHASGAVAVCPVCGAPADPGDTGRCRYCQADITTRTAGWLVTRTATTMVGMARMDERIARMRARSPGLAPATAPPTGAPMQPPRAGA